MTSSAPTGYRGYMSVRHLLGRSVPQHVQQIVMRAYCAERGLPYLLAAAEYCMPGSTMVLDTLLLELPQLAGIVCYSVGTLPPLAAKRREFYERCFALGKTLHFASEAFAVSAPAHVRAMEEGFVIMDILKEGGGAA